MVPSTGMLLGRGMRGGGASGHVEEGELVSGEEAELEPAEDVVHDALGVADLFVAGPAGGFEAGVGELFDEHFERDAVLEGEGDGGGEGVHESGDGGAFLRHADEDFAGLAGGVEADGDVALVAGEGEFVGEGGALLGEAVADGLGWALSGRLDRGQLRVRRTLDSAALRSGWQVSCGARPAALAAAALAMALS